MRVEDFLIELQDIVQTENEITVDTVLAEMEEWDSMSAMSCMAWFNVHLGIKLAYNDFVPLVKVQDIINLSQGKITG